MAARVLGISLPPVWARLVGALCTPLSFCMLVVAPADAGMAWLKPDLKNLDRGATYFCQERLAALEERQACTGSGRTVLRLGSYIANVGTGPLEYVPAPPAQDLPADCHGDGNPDITGDGVADDNDVLVRQRLYADRDRDGVFSRGLDTGSRTFTVGCRYYHPVHDHYHVESFARFELRSVSTGSIVRVGPKISFCVGDREPFDLTLPGAPQPVNGDGYYGFSDCHIRLSTQGSSVGWYDLYGWRLSGQEIDVTGLPAGRYCLVARTDPLNRIVETNEDNNKLVRQLFIDPAKAPLDRYRKLSSRPGCPAAIPERTRTVELPASGWSLGPRFIASPDRIMRPSNDLVSGWDVVGSSLAWLALDDGPGGWREPNGDAYLTPTAAGQVSEVGFAPVPLSQSSVATAWFYGKTSDAVTQLQMDVRLGGVTRETYTLPPGAPYAWRGVLLSALPAGIALDDISLRFSAVGGSGAIVRQAWVEVNEL
jgi:hypothetical protein